MVTDNRPTSSAGTNARPAGVEGDGLDSYPTYHDARTTPHATTNTRPTDTDLPRSRRTYGLPLFLGLLAFAAVIVIYMVMGGINMVATSEEAEPEDAAAAPVAGAPAAADTPAFGEQAEAPGTLDRDVDAGGSTSPGQVEAAPGAIDSPGGEITEPVGQAPAQ
jgi:hypothetical protein